MKRQDTWAWKVGPERNSPRHSNRDHLFSKPSSIETADEGLPCCASRVGRSWATRLPLFNGMWEFRSWQGTSGTIIISRSYQTVSRMWWENEPTSVGAEAKLPNLSIFLGLKPLSCRSTLKARFVKRIALHTPEKQGGFEAPS